MCVPVGLLKRLAIRERPGRWMHCFLRRSHITRNIKFQLPYIRKQVFFR